MAKISDNAVINSIRLAEQGDKPSSPAAGYWKAYAKSDGLYLIDSGGTEYGPFGSGSGDVAWATIQAAQLVNEVMNFPSLERADDTQPEWWEEGDAHATLTEVDVAGEGITETYARAHKVVTDGDGAYSYQRYTYADQPRTKSGRKLSAIYAVWAVGGKAARIRLQSSVGSLGVSADTTTAGWTILKVEGVTLDGTYVDIRCEVDTGTAYFVPLGINIGAKAVPLPPRGLSYRQLDSTVYLRGGTNIAPEASFSDVDVTSYSSALAVLMVGHVKMWEATDIWNCYVRRNGSAGGGIAVATVSSGGTDAEVEFTIILDDNQIFEQRWNRQAGSSNLDGGYCQMTGYWEWA